MVMSAKALVLALFGASDATIPSRTLPGGVNQPMLYMGSGDFTSWLKLVGKGGGIKTAWEYGDDSQRNMLPQVYAAGLKREDVFLETMIPCGGIDSSVEPMNSTQARWYIDHDLEMLGTDYIDLLAMHHRCHTIEETLAAWKELEKAVADGKARAIGVSNFDASDLKELLPHVSVPIAINEAHFSVGVMDYETIALCKEHNIGLVSFSSLAAGVPLDDPTVTAIATKHNVSTAQVIYRFVSMHDIAVLASFGKMEHAVEDAAIFDFELDEQDMAELKALQTEEHTCPDCYTHECQACAQALIDTGCPVGNMPAWGRDNSDSAECMACASEHTDAIEICGTKVVDMVSKACGTSGGFPSADSQPTLVV